MRFTYYLTSSTLMLALLTSSCAPKLGGDDYASSSVGEISVTLKGKILSVRPVEIHAKDNSEPGAGAVIGGIGGAIAGSTLGKGSGSGVMALIGAVGGGFAGHAVEQQVTQQTGFEYQVELDRGDIITITQGASPSLQTGQRVLVIESGKGRSRITADRT